MDYFYVVIVIIVIVAGAIGSSLLANWHTRRGRRLHIGNDHHQYDTIAPINASFEDQLKSAGMKPGQTVIFGQNSFAYDRDKGKLLVRSKDVLEGVLLHSREVLSYTLLRDGHIIAQRGRDGGEGIAATSLSSDCERIELRLDTKHKDNPQIKLVLMPFRFERQETRDSAMDAARSIAAALEEVLGERE